MSEIDDETPDSSNGTDEPDDTPAVSPDETDRTPDETPVNQDDTPDESDDVKKLKEQNIKLFERAKKAEGFAKDDEGNWVKKESKKPGPKLEPEKDKDLSAKDAILLMKSGVDNDEDIDEVVRFAKFQNISINKALESKTMKTILAERKEERQTAEAANTKGGRRGAAKVSEETLLDNARKGQFPDDPAELAKARFANKFSK